MEGFLLFSGVSLTHVLYSAVRTVCHDIAVAKKVSPPTSSSSSSSSQQAIPSQVIETAIPTNVSELFQAIENRIQKDEGGRGIRELILQGELQKIAEALSDTTITNIVIITGFPCMLDYSPPTETDGPLGALAIAR
jgi:hypothetical protein